MSNNQKGWDGASRRGGVNVGYGNFVFPQRIIAILESGSLPTKRMRDKSVQANMLVDATAGRKTRSLIVMDSQHVVLSALAPQTLNDRLLEAQSRNTAALELEGGEIVE